MGVAPWVAMLPPLRPVSKPAGGVTAAEFIAGISCPNHYRLQLTRNDRQRAHTLASVAADLSAARHRIELALDLLAAGKGPR